MIDPSLRCLFTLGIFIGMPFVLAWIFLIPRMSRKRYSLIATLIVAGQMFVLIVIYAESNRFLIGVVLFLLLLPGGYLTMYSAYPILEARQKKRKKHD